MDMTKFEYIEDSGFTAIAGELRRWVKALDVSNNAVVTGAATSQQQQVEQRQSAQCTQKIAQQPIPSITNTKSVIVPYTSNPGFIGRTNILNKIRKILRYS